MTGYSSCTWPWVVLPLNFGLRSAERRQCFHVTVKLLAGSWLRCGQHLGVPWDTSSFLIRLWPGILHCSVTSVALYQVERELQGGGSHPGASAWTSSFAWCWGDGPEFFYWPVAFSDELQLGAAVGMSDPVIHLFKDSALLEKDVNCVCI